MEIITESKYSGSDPQEDIFMKKQPKYQIIKSFSVGFIVFLLGFVSMNVWWNVLPRNGELYGLYYYKAATWGDGICLPLLTGALYYICRYVRKSDDKKMYFIIGVCTGLLGFGVQVSWLLDDNIVLNWTIPEVHYFNVAGFWHAFFFVLMFGILGRLLSQYIWEKSEKENSPSVLLCNFIIWFAGALFLMLHCLDDYITPGKEKVPLLFIAAVLSVVVSLCIIYVRKIKKESEAGELTICAVSGILAALGVCLVIVGRCSKMDILAIGNFALVFVYLIPRGERIANLMKKGIIVGAPALFLDFAIISIQDTWLKIALLIIGILFSLIASCKFNRVCLKKVAEKENSEINKEVMAYAITGLLMQIAAGSVLLFLDMQVGEVIDSAVAFILNLILGKLINVAVQRNFAYVKETEDSNKEKITPKSELSAVKKSVYFLIVMSAIGGVIYLVLIMQNYIQVNDLYIKLELNWISRIVCIYGVVLLILLFVLGMVKNIYTINRKIYTVIVYGIALCTYAMLFLLLKEIRTPLTIKFDIVNLCVLILMLGSSFMVSESFYSNLFRIRGIRSHKGKVKVASFIIFAGCTFNIGVCVFPVCEADGAGYNIEYMMIGVLGMVITLVLIPWLFARAVCPEIAYTQIATTTPEEGVLQNGFLGTLIAVLIGQFPGYFMTLNESGKHNWMDALVILVSLVLLIVWILEYCLLNNVEALKKYQKEVEKLGENQIARMELKGLERHLQLQNISSVVALLFYSMIPFAIEVGQTIMREGNAKEIWKKYIPKL